MSGTFAGGKAARATNYERHGPDYYRGIGALGGKVKGTKGGFASSHELAVRAGTLGGKMGKGLRKNKLTGKYESQDIQLTVEQ